MQVKHIYFDIDNTLINTSQLKKNWSCSFESLGIPRVAFASLIEKYSSSLDTRTDFDPAQFLGELTRAFPHLEEQIIQQTFWQKVNFETAVYPEVVHVLTNLMPIAVLHVLSEGIKEWQDKKLVLSGLAKFFPEEQRIIERRKCTTQTADRLMDNSVGVDDKSEVVAYFRQHAPSIKMYHLDRFSPGNSSVDEMTIPSLDFLMTKSLAM